MNVKNMRRHIACLLLYLAALGAGYSVDARWEDIHFQHLSIEDGLSQSTANCILQDRNGFIWIATEDGLNKYDGYTFKIYLPVPHDTNSLSNNSIWSLYEDSLGTLWVGTYNGLNRFDLKNEKITRYMHDPDNPKGLSHQFVKALYEDSRGALWIGTYGGGLNRLNRETGIFNHYKNNPDDIQSLSNDIVLSVYEDRSGRLWIGTNDGLDRFNSADSKFIRYTNDPSDRSSISNNTVHTIYEDRSGILWIGTANGLNRFDPGTEKFTQYKKKSSNPNSISHNDVRSIYEDLSGIIWVGTDNGLNRFDRSLEIFSHIKNNPNDPASISNNSIRSIYEDRSGVLWIGTWGGALNKCEREKKKFAHYNKIPNTGNCLNNPLVLAIYHDQQGILWLGTYGGGLNRFDRRSNRFTFYQNNPKDPYSLSNDRVRVIYEDRSGLLWIGTWGGGLNSFDRQTGRFSRFQYNPHDTASISSDYIRALYEDKDGILWVGTDGGGLNAFNRKTKEFTCYRNVPDDSSSISSNRVFWIIKDKSGSLWIATFGGGLIEYDLKDKRFIQYKNEPGNPNSLIHDYIITVYEDNSGMLWIGTDGKGLCKFDRKNGTFTLYDRLRGLPNNVVYGIVEDDSGNLWISHNMGLSRFNPHTETFKNYNIRDGIQSNEFNGNACFKNVKTGELFFGGVNGFNTFFPDSIKDNLKVPPMVITDFQIFNKSVPAGKYRGGRIILKKSITETGEIGLSYHDNVFSFEFAALHYVAPDKNQYAYIMEGFDKDWNYVGANRRYATYTNLKPGMYNFRVKGSNNDGVWNEQGKSLKIVIVPPLWKTWWFYTLCIIVIVLLITSIFIYQMKQVEKKKIEKERLKLTEIFSTVLEQGTTAVYRRKIESDTYEYMGAGIKDITGYGAGEFTFPFWNKIIVEIDPGNKFAGLSLDDIYTHIRNGETDRMVLDMKIRTKSGEIKWIRDITAVLRDESGTFYACFGIFFDITDRKLVEQELARTSDELRLKNEEMEKDLSIAREVQMALLSQHQPYFPHGVAVEQSTLHFLYKYIPASTLGGDFFEIFPISDHEVGMLIYDIMGHGVRASLLTAYFHGVTEELLPIAADPVAFMKRLNIGLNAFVSQFYTGLFATAFYMVADIKAGKMRYTNAGHPMPFVLGPKTGIVEKLQLHTKKTEPALGLIKDFNYTFSEYPMSVDDIILFFTDGIFEVENIEGKHYGGKQFFECVRRHINTPPGQLIDAIIHEVNEFTNQKEFKDDVCVVAMHVRKAPFI